MSIPREKVTIHSLITEGLGYCCPWFFFRHFRKTTEVADRLGVTPRAVRYAKGRVRDGEWKCEGKANCMDCKITRAGTARRTRLAPGCEATTRKEIV